MENQRQHGFDNVRCILIFLVVFGHFIEHGGSESRLYLLIYTFHMPVFSFLSGWFSRFCPRRLLKTAGLYLLFQFLYRAADWLLSGGSFALKPLTPYWTLWYLPFLIYCQLLLPLLDRFPRFPVLPVSLLTALAAGYVPFIGYGLTLSRFFVFFPYFILGHRMRLHQPRLKQAAASLPGWVLPGLLAVGLSLSLGLTRQDVTARMLYGASSYSPGYGPALRGLLYLPGTVWCLFFLILALRSRRIPLVSSVGRNTMPIYLFHGFAVKLVRRFSPLPQYPHSLLWALLLSITIMFLFGYLPSRRLSRPRDL